MLYCFEKLVLITVLNKRYKNVLNEYVLLLFNNRN